LHREKGMGMEDFDKLFSLWEEKESKNLSRKVIGKE